MAGSEREREHVENWNAIGFVDNPGIFEMEKSLFHIMRHRAQKEYATLLWKKAAKRVHVVWFVVVVQYWRYQEHIRWYAMQWWHSVVLACLPFHELFSLNAFLHQVHFLHAVLDFPLKGEKWNAAKMTQRDAGDTKEALLKRAGEKKLNSKRHAIRHLCHRKRSVFTTVHAAKFEQSK